MSGKMSGHKKKIHPIVEGNFYGMKWATMYALWYFASKELCKVKIV